MLGCSKESEHNQLVNERLQGTWFFTQWIIDGSAVFVVPESLYLSFLNTGEEDGSATWGDTRPPNVERVVEYKVIDGGNKVDIDGDIYELKKLTDEELIIHGTIDGSLSKIKAEKG